MRTTLAAGREIGWNWSEWTTEKVLWQQGSNTVVPDWHIVPAEDMEAHALKVKAMHSTGIEIPGRFQNVLPFSIHDGGPLYPACITPAMRCFASFASLTGGKACHHRAGPAGQGSLCGHGGKGWSGFIVRVLIRVHRQGLSLRFEVCSRAGSQQIVFGRGPEGSPQSQLCSRS